MIQNIGSGPTPDGVVIGVSFWVDGTEVNWSDTYSTSLAPGDSITLTANSGPSGFSIYSAVAGTHTVKAWVNDIRRFSESNTSNNQTTTTTTVSP